MYLILWTPGALTTNDDGEPTLCPRSSICSEGAFEIVLIALARLSAFASYVACGVTFASKMHSLIHFLSHTYLEIFIPFELLHHMHVHMGSVYAGLAWLHTVTHLIRWGVRSELARQCETQVGWSGLIAITAMTSTVFFMSPLGKKIKDIAFEVRFLNHRVGFAVLTAGLCLHTQRTRQITLGFALLWAADYLYGVIFRTHRLDVVEFSPLPEGAGTQLLWRNPKGFTATSGEYVLVNVPWLKHREWHPFSIYLKEATKEGMSEIKRKERQRIYVGDESKGGRPVDPKKTAIILIEFQNEFTSPGGKLHDSVKEVMAQNGMLEKTVDLVKACREAGVQVFHAPVIFREDGTDNPNSNLGVLKNCRNNELFIENTWNADFVDVLKPQLGDCIVKDKHGLDCFPGTNLEQLLIEKGIDSLILAGFLTNCCVESTMRTAFEKGLNTITVVDGTACTSKSEQLNSVNHTYKMFSTPLTCEQIKAILRGQQPDDKGMPTGTYVMEASKETPDEIHVDTEAPKAEQTLESSVVSALSSPFEQGDDVSEIARMDLTKKYNTTQVFVVPAGDWSKKLFKEVSGRQQYRSIWVRGPFTSPYFVAKDFNHLVLMASGIGITPALGIMGQYPGVSRTKILVWSTRSRSMLKFFAPHFRDTHMVVVFYTGKEKLTPAEITNINSYGNIHIQQSRPESLTLTIAKLIVLFENDFAGDGDASGIQSICPKLRKEWCLLYCGGSIRIRDDLAQFTEEAGIGWQYELFDW